MDLIVSMGLERDLKRINNHCKRLTRVNIVHKKILMDTKYNLSLGLKNYIKIYYN